MSIQADQPVDPADFINVSERNATKSNDAGRVFKAEADGYQNAITLRTKVDRNTLQDIDGTTTPKAVALDQFKKVLMQEAGYFHGFTKEDSGADVRATYLNGSAGYFAATQEQFSFTANAGTDRVLIVAIWVANGLTKPSGASWNSINLTLLEDQLFASSNDIFQVWYAPIGDSGSNETFDVIFTGANFLAGSNVAAYSSLVYVDADQTTPIATTTEVVAEGTALSATATSSVIQPAGYGTIVLFGYGTTSGTITTTGFNNRNSGAVDGGDVIGVSAIPSITSTNNGCIVLGVAVNAVSTVGNPIEVITEGVVDGFSALTIDAEYFVDGNAGAVSTTGNGPKVGTAVSTTEIMVNEKLPLPVACRIIQTGTNFLTTGGTWYKLNYAGELFDFSEMHDVTTNNERITFTEGGLYLIGATTSIPGNNYGAGVYILLNGTTKIAGTGSTDGYGTINLASASTIYRFSAGDYIEFYAKSDANSAVTSGNEETNAWAIKIA